MTEPLTPRAFPDQQSRSRSLARLAWVSLVLHGLQLASALAITRPLLGVSRGLDDTELLAPGGLFVLELVRVRYEELLGAVTDSSVLALFSLVLLAVPSLLVFRVAGSVAAQSRRLATPRALDSSSVITFAVLGALGWACRLLGYGALAGAVALLLRSEHSYRVELSLASVAFGTLLAAAPLVCVDLLRLAAASGVRPRALQDHVSRMIRGRFSRLWATRALCGAYQAALPLGALFWVVGPDPDAWPQRLAGALLLQVLLFSAVLLRTLWLTWAAAHASAEKPA